MKTSYWDYRKRKTHPDDDIMMSYVAKGFVEGVKDAGGIPIILPIGDQEMACHYISMIDKLILTGGKMSIKILW